MACGLRHKTFLTFVLASALAGCSGGGATPNAPQRLPDAHATVGRSSSPETILYAFKGGSDGAFPYAGLYADKSGDLFGTTDGGGSSDLGTVFKFSASGSESVVHSFKGAPDGALPYSTLVEGKKGVLYGTTYSGGAFDDGCAFELVPTASGYLENVIYSFSGSAGDGGNPYAGLLYDAKSGALYGTTLYGGAYGPGSVFKLVPTPSGWTESIVYSFEGGSDGAIPYAGLVEDKSGALYGTTILGGPGGNGTVYKLTPASGSYTESILYGFTGTNGDGQYPFGTLTASGAYLYGTTLDGGANGDGLVFAVKAKGGSNAESALYSFQGGNDGANPMGGVIVAKGGTLYGMTSNGGEYSAGTLFALTRTHKTYAESVVYAFGGYPDGGSPFGGPIETKSGTLEGLTFNGGYDGDGTIFAVTP